MNKLAGVVAVLLSLGMSTQADWLDTFDSEAADAGAPDNYGVFGSPLDSGVTATMSVSAPNSAFVVADLDGGSFGFEVILVHDFVAAMSMNSATLSVELAASVDLSGGLGNVAFHLYDADGSEWRTGNGDLFAPSTTFSTFTQNINDLSEQVVVGTTPGLDTANIVRYGLDFYDQAGAGDQNTTFYVDNFSGVAVPEPGSGAFLLFAGTLWDAFRRRK